ncbi:MAG: uracil phosphoribosyltransferase [Methylotenera sp.]|nr:uracil phosphoribosyltransferase [Oligoflexia bacterium]
MRDRQFETVRFQLSEMKHHYGAGVHLLSDPYLLSILARLCSAETTQPLINELVQSIYSSLLRTVVAHEFPTQNVSMATRMSAVHPVEGVYEGPVIDPETPVVSVNLARAGTYPSHLCYTALNYFMNPLKVRQDHISIARTTDQDEKVTGTRVSGHKIGGMTDNAIVLFPDPMGATGSTLVEAVDIYKKSHGKAMKYVALHCIVTPEYLKKMKSKHPDVIVYAVRLDRGLSAPEILKFTPGQHWDQERGLNEKHYIVPGGGGFGEIMNNAYV